MHRLLPLHLFSEKKTQTPGGIFGSILLDCIHILIPVTWQSSPTRTRDRKTPLQSIYGWLVTFIVHTIDTRISLRCAEEVVRNHPTLLYGCTTSWCATWVLLLLSTIKMSISRTWRQRLCDESQYPAARCAMGESVYMHHCLSSGAVELMNKANKDMRAWMTVDLLNACMLLIKLCVRFNKMKQEAWGGDSVLTPWGKEDYDDTFTNLPPSHFIFHLHDYNDHWQMKVFRSNIAGRHEQILCLPKSPVNGSYILVHALVEQTRWMQCHVSI